jgi:hypothetical protein
MKEAEIIDQAIANFQQITGAIVRTELANGRDQGTDGLLEINFEGRNERLNMEVKNELRSIQLQKLLTQFQRPGLEWILLAQYIPPAIKEQLKLEKINYLEATGNCFIKTGDFYFFINDRKVTETRLLKEGKLWNATGVKFVFAILTIPEALRLPYRQIARYAGIALGNVGPLLAELRNEGFLLQGPNGDMLANKDILRDKWVELYPTVLRPKIRLGRFRKPEHTQFLQNLPEGVIWGGENAGEVMTGHLIPEQFTLYTTEPKNTVMRKLKLIPDPQGKLEMFAQFWPEELQAKQLHKDAVPPLIAFAELATHIDSRNHETAERIKEKYLI